MMIQFPFDVVSHSTPIYAPFQFNELVSFKHFLLFFFHTFILPLVVYHSHPLFYYNRNVHPNLNPHLYPNPNFNPNPNSNPNPNPKRLLVLNFNLVSSKHFSWFSSFAFTYPDPISHFDLPSLHKYFLS